ncbi:uncharacterized protein LOC135077049 isoform X2 [Ostrinia nubilalis]|uniref:uncharacterized protein LOC135077049 isoform X2 n=1 Tax=Ostrinia nubilalis TaxID=29057 RepID=UPI0030822F77
MRGRLLLLALLVAVICTADAQKHRRRHRRPRTTTTEAPGAPEREDAEAEHLELGMAERLDERRFQDAEKARVNEIMNEGEGLSENEVFPDDPCLKVHCSAGRVCEIDEHGDAVCNCIKECPYETDSRRKVCTNHNETWSSDCEVYRQRCLCLDGSELCRAAQYHHVQIEYYGVCREMPTCTESEMLDFPRRMRDWLFNIMRDMAERSELTPHYLRMEREAESNLTRRWTNAAVWKWCDLDAHDNDRWAYHTIKFMFVRLAGQHHADMAERSELTPHYLRMEREAESNLTRRWTNAAVWKWCDLDAHDNDRWAYHTIKFIFVRLAGQHHADMAERSELTPHYLRMEREAESNLTRRWTNAAVWKWCDLDAHDNDRWAYHTIKFIFVRLAGQHHADMAERSELTPHYLRMEREAESNLTRRWTNAAVWKWCDLDAHDNDRFVSRHELFPIRAPLMALEHCIAPFLDSCDADDDHRITLAEWGKCLQLDEYELEDRCDEFTEDSA